MRKRNDVSNGDWKERPKMAVVLSLNSRNYGLGPRFYYADWPIRPWSSQGVEGTSCRAREASPSCGELPKHGKPHASELFIKLTLCAWLFTLLLGYTYFGAEGLVISGRSAILSAANTQGLTCEKARRGMTMALLVSRRSILFVKLINL